jgi:hypothetical protein
MDDVFLIKERRGATRHSLSRTEKYIDFDGGIFGRSIVLGKLHRLCHLNNKYWY